MTAVVFLICRPLMAIPTGLGAGFAPGPVLAALGVDLAPGQDLQSCSRPDSVGCPPPEVLA